MKEILQVWRELDANNHREWMEANRSRYAATQKEFQQATAQLISGIAGFDKEVASLKPKDCIFRIFRDVRFSNDKRPYKNNYGAYMVRGGKKSGNAGYYLHIQPGECFVAGGNYMPSPEQLQAIRQEIYYHPEEYLGLLNGEPFHTLFNIHYRDALKTAPKGYPKDWEHIELLKNRSFGFGHALTDEEVTAPDFISKCTELFRVVQPVNSFLNKAVDENMTD
ncbi:MAG: DUF2461 domain-containing protein [Marinilabiliales bacterium]|nr:DUF2461 domain-containing protein [Marinilabiliales bacterium]